MWGITEAVAHAFGYQGPIRAMPRAAAMEIDRSRYRTQAGFEHIAEIDGPLGAALLLQRLLNVLNAWGSLYADITVECQCSAMTRGALDSLIKRRGVQARAVLLKAVWAL